MKNNRFSKDESHSESRSININFFEGQSLVVVFFSVKIGEKKKKNCKHTILGIREVWSNHR